MTALEREASEHVHDSQRIGRFEACISCGEILSERWEPRSLTDVTYVMELRHHERVQINALKARIRNLEQMVKQHEARDRWLGMRWAVAIQNIVAVHLAEARSKLRSILTEFGRAGFRRSHGSIEILDQDAAVAWCEAHMPEAVAVEKTVRKTPLKGLEHELPEAAFRVHPPEDTFFVEVTA